MEKQRNWTGWLLIVIMIIVVGVALVFTTLADGQPESFTEGERQEAALRKLFPKADVLERVDTDSEGFIYAARQGAQLLGYAVQTTVSGYGGPIEIISAIQPDHRLAGIQVGGENFNETPNLGARARDAEFTGQFQGKAIPLRLHDDIDAIAGATVTSQAVVNGVNQAVQRLYSLSILEQAPTNTPAPAAQTPAHTANVSAMGYGGPVLVRLTVNEQGVIEAIDIGGARFQETEGVGSRVKDEGFVQAFIGKTPPLTLGEDIDGVSGATVSSQAVVDAVNEAYQFLSDKN